MSDKRTWLMRVAQEFTFEAATADDALTMLRRAEVREIEGAELIDARGALTETTEQEDSPSDA